MRQRILEEAPTPDRYDSRAQARTAILCPVADVAALVPSYESLLLFGHARSAVHHPARPARVLTMIVGLRDAEDVLTYISLRQVREQVTCPTAPSRQGTNYHKRAQQVLLPCKHSFHAKCVESPPGTTPKLATLYADRLELDDAERRCGPLLRRSGAMSLPGPRPTSRTRANPHLAPRLLLAAAAPAKSSSGGISSPSMSRPLSENHRAPVPGSKSKPTVLRIPWAITS